MGNSTPAKPSVCPKYGLRARRAASAVTDDRDGRHIEVNLPLPNEGNHLLIFSSLRERNARARADRQSRNSLGKSRGGDPLTP